jgi:type IV pilus assembly protein PilA
VTRTKLSSNRPFNKKKDLGFSLTELITAVSIVGTLSAISVPAYIGQANRGCQNDAENSLHQLMPTAQAFNDEYGTPATGWSDLNRMGTLMTNSGPAKGNGFGLIELASCNYGIRGTQNGNQYIFESFDVSEGGGVPLTQQASPPSNSGSKSGFNVVACLNVATGASDLRRGDGSTPASISDLACS